MNYDDYRGPSQEPGWRTIPVTHRRHFKLAGKVKFGPPPINNQSKPVSIFDAFIFVATFIFVLVCNILGIA